MNEIAKNHEISPSEVAINWILKQKDITPIPGAKKIQHVKSNIHSMQWKLIKDEYNQLTKATDNIELNDFKESLY